MARVAPVFSAEEADALLLGLCLVAQQEQDEDTEILTSRLSERIAGMVPASADQEEVDELLAQLDPDAPHRTAIETAFRQARKMDIAYTDKKGAETRRVIWPVSIAFLGGPVLAAWCETRCEFRQFRLDRMTWARCLAETVPRSRRLLTAEWRAKLPPD